MTGTPSPSLEVGVRGGAQGRMQHGAALGGIDRLAPEQGARGAFDVGGAGQVQRGFEARRVQACFDRSR
jgi:hypothetical protein